MKENKYDNDDFFSAYSKMDRSVKGLTGAGEWHVLKEMLPDLYRKKLLDLGCGYGWHCKYAIEQGAAHVTGIDISKKMLDEARKINNAPNIEYIQIPIEDYNYPAEAFDIVLSSLTFHYIESFDLICKKINQCLRKGGNFIFSVEHPVFTAQGSQDWHYTSQGEKQHWPVDNYFYEGKREAVFLDHPVTKYHKTLTTYLNGLLLNGFEIKNIVEPEPDEALLKEIPALKEEFRRPMMLIISATKKAP